MQEESQRPPIPHSCEDGSFDAPSVAPVTPSTYAARDAHQSSCGRVEQEICGKDRNQKPKPQLQKQLHYCSVLKRENELSHEDSNSGIRPDGNGIHSIGRSYDGEQSPRAVDSPGSIPAMLLPVDDLVSNGAKTTVGEHLMPKATPTGIGLCDVAVESVVSLQGDGLRSDVCAGPSRDGALPEDLHREALNQLKQKEEDILGIAEASLATLCTIHDHFFSSNPIEKQERLKMAAEDVMKALSGVQDLRDIQNRARMLYIRGRTLDVCSEYNSEAESCLAKAVKLRPSDTDAWNALGNCYWKKPDLLSAKRCFLQALQRRRNLKSLLQLSMLLRQLPGTAQEANDHLQESLRLAKEAVTLDVGNGEAWYVLGNAYVSSFFRDSKGVKDLDRALQAYKKAESNGSGGNPDLFFNRAQLYLYREDYPEAVKDLRTAHKMDPLLPVGEALHAIETGVDRLAKLVKNKGGLKPKRLAQLTAPLNGHISTKGVAAPLRLVCLRELRLGKNMGYAVAFKLVMPAGKSLQPPERFVVVDGNGDCAVLSLYSIAKEACERIHGKCTLVVTNPALRTIGLGLHTPLPIRSLYSSPSDANDENLPGGKLVNESSADTAPVTLNSGTQEEPAAPKRDTDRTTRENFQAANLSQPSSYLGIQADPADLLLNGESMKTSFAPPSVRLANFDKWQAP